MADPSTLFNADGSTNPNALSDNFLYNPVTSACAITDFYLFKDSSNSTQFTSSDNVYLQNANDPPNTKVKVKTNIPGLTDTWLKAFVSYTPS